MATKKPATKRKTTAAKKTTVRKKPVAKSAKATKTTRRKKSAVRSFKLSRQDTPFLTFALTIQTLYWTILSLAVLALGIWIIALQTRVNALYDQIETNQAQYQIMQQTADSKKQK